jgi:hypothetical protein
VQIAPKWFETSDTWLVVKLGLAFGAPFTTVFKLCAIITDQ